MPTTRTTIQTVYSFDELSESAKEHAISENRYINVDHDWWFEYDGKMGFSKKEIFAHHLTKEESQLELIEWKKLYFSINREWYIQFSDAEFSNDELARKFLGVPKNIWDRTSWTIEDMPHRNTNTRLTYYWDGNNESTKKQEEILERAVEKFSDKIEEALKGLQSTYDWSCEDEQIKDTLIANDYEFDEDGNII